MKAEYTWTNADFALVLIAFRVAYAVGQTIAGRVIDRLGTRDGLSLAVLCYSVAAAGAAQPALPNSTLLRLPQTWGYILSKSFTDPV